MAARVPTLSAYFASTPGRPKGISTPAAKATYVSIYMHESSLDSTCVQPSQLHSTTITLHHYCTPPRLHTTWLAVAWRHTTQLMSARGS